MIGTQGQKVKSVEEAADFIREFMQFEREHVRELNHNKDFDFDLYLPWMMEIVDNSPEEEGSRPPYELDEIYMEAAWSIVMQGYLRPGARAVSGANPGDGYGKGFSLTVKGKEWIKKTKG